MSTVQFNLLPDVKLDYAKAQASRGKTASLAFLASVIALGLLVVLVVFVDVLQKKQLNDATSQVNSATSQLQAVPNLSKVLTVQNQLQTLSTLHANKHVTSRIFGYLAQLTPSAASLGQLTLDTTTSALTISGTADSQQTVNTFIDTLKFAQYQVGSSSTLATAFPSVTESGFSIGAGNVSYSLTIQYDPQIFSNALKDAQGNSVAPALVVKSQTTTRSVLEDPGNNLFNGQK